MLVQATNIYDVTLRADKYCNMYIMTAVTAGEKEHRLLASLTM